MSTKRMNPHQLREVREMLGWSWPRLADALGVRADTVRKWASGEDLIPYNVPSELRAIAQNHTETLTELIDQLDQWTDRSTS